MPKFVIAAVEINEAGFEEYRFSENPYVHRKQSHAEQEARNLARKLNGEMAVFQKISTVGVVNEPEEAPPQPPT